jgi:transposase
MSRTKHKLKRSQVGGLPLIRKIAERLRLREHLCRYIPTHGNEQVSAVDSLMLVIFNLSLGKDPLYELESWISSLDERCLGYENLERARFNDDRFGRALDKLYVADRASLMTELVIGMAKEFALDLGRIHNDSTTVKAYGKIPGRTTTGLELKLGHSKDHRPDLKQLLFCLSVSSDGAVPVHQKSYAGNTTDDKTHIETWKILRAITGTPGFLYVADSKLCTDEQLSYITGQGGRVVTIIPESWGEVGAFKASLRRNRKPKKEIWRRPIPGNDEEIEYYSTFLAKHVTTRRNYPVHWIYSSEKKKRDRVAREVRLKKTERRLAELGSRLNKRKLKTKKAIVQAAENIMEKETVQSFFHVDVGTTKEEYRFQIGKGRPGKNTKYKRRIKTIYTLNWARHEKALKEEARTDGIFPLLCTDESLSSKQVLQAYKYQPRLEKRFSQFKSIHKAAPLLFKKIERVEANMFAFFVALMIQALIEREVRREMKTKSIASLKLYPESREAAHPTTSKIMRLFEPVSTYRITGNGHTIEEFKDDLNATQKKVLKLIKLSENSYWQSPDVSK